MTHRDIVVIGASAGGLALKRLLGAMPGDLDAAILIVLHTASHSGSLLPNILTRAGNLPVTHPQDGEPIQPDNVYIAPPGFHMIVEEGFLRVVGVPARTCNGPP